MTTGAFIIARLSSSRLPAKNMMKILDIPMIQLMVERIRAARTIDKIIITTSSEASDDPLESLAKTVGVDCYRGPLNNIMERITGAANRFKCHTIVELLGDNPLVHSDLIDDTVSLFREGRYQYAATVTKEYPVCPDIHSFFSVGLRVQVYETSAAAAFVEYPEYIGNEDKHPCSYIFDNPDRFKVGFLEAEGKWKFMNRPHLNFAVNYKKNFDLVRSVFEVQYPLDHNFSLERLYEQMDIHRHLYTLMGSEQS